MLRYLLVFLVFGAQAMAAAGGEESRPAASSSLLSEGGAMMWILLLTAALAIYVFIDRILHYHRAQIQTAEFLNGVRNVVKRENIVEALSICDATPGPVARLVKVAILNRDKGREGVREALEDAGLIEVPKLEAKLNILATVAQLAPVMGLLGTVLGFMEIFRVLQAHPYPHAGLLAGGVWKALICTGFGLAISIPSHAGYNYLLSRVNTIVLDMERASSEILNLVSGPRSVHEISAK